MIVRRSLLGAAAVVVTLMSLGAGELHAEGRGYHPFVQHLHSNVDDGFARGLLALGALHATQRHVNFGPQPSHGAAIQHIRQQYPVHQIRTTAPNPHVNYGHQPSRGAAIQHIRQLYPAQQIRIGGSPHGFSGGHGHGGHH
ncbi:MAG: hypothetical protein HQ582_34050 [Planctomycetes bacterium]|nr:hypothetical protein [Planctomycetota bacterium]